MLSMDDNENDEFVSHFFRPVSNTISEPNNQRHVNNEIKNNDVFCFTGLMQSLLESNDFKNGSNSKYDLESESLAKYNTFDRKELAANDVGELVKYVNRISIDCESNECSDIAICGAHTQSDKPCIQMNQNNRPISAEFVSKYFVQTAEQSTITLDYFNSVQEFSKGDNISGFDAVCQEILTIDEDDLNNAHAIQISEFVDDYNEEEREFRISQLDPQDETIIVEPFFNISSRNMPVSPHGIIEDEFKSNPWAMLVATIFLTKTTGKAARPLMKDFFSTYPTPYEILNTDPVVLEKYFITLGMRKRASMIWRMSFEFVSAKWRRASDLHGIGKYGEDAYRIFCLGHTDIEPTDRYLRLYLDWLKSQTDHDETFGNVDSECVIVDPVLKYYSITLR